MQEEKDILDNANDEKEIDLLELATKLWEQRKKLIIWSICGAVIGLIVAFSIPKEYDTTVKLAPEISDPKAASGGLGSTCLNGRSRVCSGRCRCSISAAVS